MFPNFVLPPLETESGDLNNEREESGEVSSFYKKIKAKLELGNMDDKEYHEYLSTFIEEFMEGISKIFMQGLELFPS